MNDNHFTVLSAGAGLAYGLVTGFTLEYFLWYMAGIGTVVIYNYMTRKKQDGREHKRHG